ncbi:hypothetical protein PoHVEF18_010590 [Penicillium ochrochloron]
MGNPNYNGTELILSSGANMVVVLFNYRVSVLGFLSSNGLGHDVDLNVGLLDQRQLLRWVQKHISKVPASGSSAFPETAPGDPLPLFYWLPVIDGELIPDQFHTLFATDQFAHVPVLVGHVTNEGSWFANNASSTAEVSPFLRANYPHLKESQLEEINHAYANMAPLSGHAAFFPSASAAYGDATFACPTNYIASAVSRFPGAAKAWSYRYNVLDTEIVSGGYGVCHTLETSAVFGPGQAGWTASSY